MVLSSEKGIKKYYITMHPEFSKKIFGRQVGLASKYILKSVGKLVNHVFLIFNPSPHRYMLNY